MATKTQDFLVEDVGGRRVHVWGNVLINHLRKLEGVVYVENMKRFGYYVVSIDPRYNKDSVKDDIRALEMEATNE